jgi:hypothetical protein
MALLGSSFLLKLELRSVVRVSDYGATPLCADFIKYFLIVIERLNFSKTIYLKFWFMNISSVSNFYLNNPYFCHHMNLTTSKAAKNGAYKRQTESPF